MAKKLFLCIELPDIPNRLSDDCSIELLVRTLVAQRLLGRNAKMHVGEMLSTWTSVDTYINKWDAAVEITAEEGDDELAEEERDSEA